MIDGNIQGTIRGRGGRRPVISKSLICSDGQFEGSSGVEYCFGRNALRWVISLGFCVAFSKFQNSLPVSSSKSWISYHLSLWFSDLPLIPNTMVFCRHILLSNAFVVCKPMQPFSCKIFSSDFARGSATLGLLPFPFCFNSLRLEIRTVPFVENSVCD